MTYAQVVSDAKQLTPAEKLDLVETLLRDLRETVTSVEITAVPPMLTVEDKLRLVDQLGGILRPASGVVPDDDQLRDAYTDDLIRKYLGE